MTEPFELRLEPAENGLVRVSIDTPDGPLVFLANEAALREMRDTISRALGESFARTKRRI